MQYSCAKYSCVEKFFFLREVALSENVPNAALVYTRFYFSDRLLYKVFVCVCQNVSTSFRFSGSMFQLNKIFIPKSSLTFLWKIALIYLSVDVTNVKNILLTNVT